jgi:glycosyltransferase involved in cell wall biosynthesis
MLPKISIITPSYNQGHFIEETITSVLDQGYPNLEYIIMDGGSKDNTVEVIKKYEKHITYWVSERDKGQSDAINKGFARATGDVINWLNSDDYYAKGTLQKVGEVFTAAYLAIGGNTIQMAPIFTPAIQRKQSVGRVSISQKHFSGKAVWIR